MKHILILALFLTACAPVATQATLPTSTPQPIHPAHVDVDGLSFPLAYRDPQTESEHGVPYVDGPAFYRIIGQAIDISSHCFQDPGMYFDRIKAGDVATVTYSNGAIWKFTATEIIAIHYKSTSDPLNNLWIDATGKEYTQRQFFDYVMGRDPGAQYLVLHSSLCDPRAEDSRGRHPSFGQTFYILYPHQ